MLLAKRQGTCAALRQLPGELWTFIFQVGDASLLPVHGGWIAPGRGALGAMAVAPSPTKRSGRKARTLKGAPHPLARAASGVTAAETAAARAASPAPAAVASPLSPLRMSPAELRRRRLARFGVG